MGHYFIYRYLACNSLRGVLASLRNDNELETRINRWNQNNGCNHEIHDKRRIHM